MKIVVTMNELKASHELFARIGFTTVGTVELSEEQLAELTIIFNYSVPVCATCGKLLEWKEFVEAYANDSSFMECDSCYCSYVDTAISC